LDVPEMVIPFQCNLLPPDYDVDKTEEELAKLHEQDIEDQEKILNLIVQHLLYYHFHPEQIPKYADDKDVKEDEDEDEDIIDDINNITQWDKEFLGKLDKVTLAQLISVTNFLNYKHLLQSCAKYFASLIRGKSVEEMREILGVVNDFTPEEEERIKQENEWMKE
jgi:S-phase kinase-associated protein 1